MPSSSSSSSTTETSASPEEEQLYLLTNTDLLREAYLSDVTPVPEPNVERFPVLRIGFSAPFDSVYGAYRALRGDMNQLLAACAKGPSAVVPPGAMARWLLLLAFALRQCMSHYTAWHDRRELILQPQALQHATRQELRRLPFVPAATAEEESHRVLLRQITESWLPSIEDLELPAGMATSTSEADAKDEQGQKEDEKEEDDTPCRVNLWRAVRWELRTTECIGLLYHKNFQVWHHRKDLISRALRTLPEGALTTIASSESACNDYLERHHAISFADLDERRITSRVFDEYDAKNYHVWLHRAWFINAFPFLVEGPQWAEWCAERASEAFPPFPPISSSSSPEAEDSLPPCPLKDEVDFTADLIEKDWWSNSAWCHRFSLFEQNVAARWLEQLEAGALSGQEVLAAAHGVLRAEIDFAVRWAAKEVSNECPFTYSLSMAAIYQRVVLYVHHHDGAAGAVSGSDAVAPRTAVSREAPWSSLQTCMPPSTFVQGFALLFYLLRALRETVCPIADGYGSTLYHTLSLVDRKDHPFLNRLRDTQTQFGLDNLHQVHSALYHGYFQFLQVCWVNYFDADMREAVRARRPPETYATQGVSDDELPDSDVWQHALGELGEGTPSSASEMEKLLSVFLLVEAAALATAKRLVVEDEIRVKYWKREIITVLFREYNLCK